MGSFYVKDIITNETIIDYDKTVGFLVIPNEDAGREKSAGPIYPNEHFSLFSLPIDSYYADYGNFEPEDQDNNIAVKLAKSIINAEDWEHLLDKSREEIDYMKKTITFGMAVIHKSTYAFLTKKDKEYEDNFNSFWTDYVATINRFLVADKQEKLALDKGDKETSRLLMNELFDIIDILNLNTDRMRNTETYTKITGKHDINRIFKTMSHHSGNFGSNSELKFHILDYIKEFCTKLSKDDVGQLHETSQEIFELKNLLIKITETNLMLGRMDELGLLIRPSSYAGQNNEPEKIIELHLETLTNSVERDISNLDTYADYGDDDFLGEKMEAMYKNIQQLKKTAQHLERQLFEYADKYPEASTVIKSKKEKEILEQDIKSVKPKPKKIKM